MCMHVVQVGSDRCDETNYIAHFMELNPSWEDVSCVATQQLYSILWNPKVYYCVEKGLPPVSVLS
jgi:hypothetical protein